MILRFEAKSGNQGPPNAYILSKNRASAFEDPAIIDKNFTEDLALGRLVEVVDEKNDVSNDRHNDLDNKTKRNGLIMIIIVITIAGSMTS